LATGGSTVPRPRPKFGHGAEATVGGRVLLGCYHPSQQNTFTGKLTRPMIDDVMRRARELGGVADPR
jgi:uracil-DNA glycosylase